MEGPPREQMVVERFRSVEPGYTCAKLGGAGPVSRRATPPLFPSNEHCCSLCAFLRRLPASQSMPTEAAMNTTWNFILAGAVTLASAAGIVSGEAAKGELRLVEAATAVADATAPATPSGGTTSGRFRPIAGPVGRQAAPTRPCRSAGRPWPSTSRPGSRRARIPAHRGTESRSLRIAATAPHAHLRQRTSPPPAAWPPRRPASTRERTHRSIASSSREPPAP